MRGQRKPHRTYDEVYERHKRPLCRKCLNHHLNFEECGGEDSRLKAAAVQTFRPREGFREGFTDRTKAYQVQAGGLLVVRRDRKPLLDERR